MSKAVCIFSGYNPRAIIALCRQFTELKVSFFIIARDNKDPILKTDYAANVYQIREGKDLVINEMLQIIVSYRESYDVGEVLLMPTSEFLNHFLLRNRTLLTSNNIVVPLIEESLYHAVSNKEAFGQLCSEHKLKVPTTIKKDHINQYPVVIKPKAYKCNDKVLLSPQVIRCEEELVTFFNTNDSANYYIQEYINGESFYLFYYISNSGETITFSQQNLIQQPDGKSIVYACYAQLHEQEIAREYKKLLLAVDYRGLIMIEVRRNDEEYYMIEANPRPWGPLQFIIDCRVPFIQKLLDDYHIEYHDKKNNSLESVDCHKIRYLWFGGLQKHIKDNTLVYHDSSIQLIDVMSHLQYDVYMRKDSYEWFINELWGLDNE